jgi:hypothetical protein
MSQESEARRGLWRAAGVLAFFLLLSVGPFLARPIHLDEPVFVWAARQISAHPLDFYGFEVNWTGTPLPVHQTMMNPPLASYYAALAARVTGWNETGLHAAFLPVALAALLGTWALARRCTSQPTLAALATLWTPAFLVSCTMVMSDTLAVAFWLWALVAWDRGLAESRTGLLLGAGLLAGFAALTEYFAIALVPLLALHAAVTLRRSGVWLAALALPVAMLLVYERASAAWYGHSLLFGAAQYASGQPGGALDAPLRTLAVGLVFTGGCAASVLFLSPVLCSRRGLWVWGLPSLLASAALVWRLCSGLDLDARIQEQVLLWCVVGLGVLALAADDLRRTREPKAVLLAAWVAGTFVFASFVNWTVNARSLLPLVPAMGILAARRLDRHAAAGRAPARVAVGAGLALSAALAIATLWADASLAAASRTAAVRIVGEFAAGGGRVWFQGHWGFQYYAERLGALALDALEPRVERGDAIVKPRHNSYLFELEGRFVGQPQRRVLPVPRWISTMNPAAGAGFYSATFGLLPFAFAGAQPEVYLVYRSAGPDLAPDAAAPPGSR